MRTLVVFLWLLFSAPAYAGSISVTITETNFANATKTYVIADADVDRIIAAYQAAANTNINGNASRAQVLLYLSKRWMATLTAEVVSYEAQKARDAVVVPNPINPQ